MRTAFRGTTGLAGIVGLALLTAGPVMVIRGSKRMVEVRTELERQRIEFPDRAGHLPTGLRHLAGRRVRSGADARACSELIRSHLDEATGGRSYGEITSELMASGNEDEKLADLRQRAFTGQSLRAGLLAAYQESNIALLVVGLGALFTGLGASLLALARATGSAGADV